MRREAKAAFGWLFLLVAAVGCGNELEEKECLLLREQAFEVINGAHTCNDDSDCLPSDWPGCARPVNAKNKAAIGEHKAKFETGKCSEPQATCRETPEVYCKQGLCVFREQAGMVNPG